MVRTVICCCLVVFVLIWGTESRSGDRPCSLRMNPSRGVINVRSGTAVSFVCSAICLGALSRGQLVWRDPNDNLVPNMGRHRIQSVSYNQFRVSRLLVHRAFPEDSGVYSCEILHNGKRLRYTASLQVAGDSDSRPDDGPRRGDIYIEPEPDFGEIRPAREASRDPARHYRSRQRHAGRVRRSLSGAGAAERGEDGEDSRAIIPLTAGAQMSREKEEEKEDVRKVEAMVPETVVIQVGQTGRREIRKLATRVRRAAYNQSVPDWYNGTTESPSNVSTVSFGNLTVTTDPANITSFGTTEKTTVARNGSDQNETTGGNVTDTGYPPTTASSKTPSTSTVKDGGIIPDKSSTKSVLTTTTPDTTSTSASTTTSTSTTTTSTTTTSTTTTTTTTTTTPVLSKSTTGSKTAGSGSGSGSGSVGTGGENTGMSKGGEEDGETDFGRYGGVAFGLAMVVIILLVVAILLYFLLPRCCKNKNLFIFNRGSRDRDDYTGSVPSQNSKDSNVILLGERPHKPVAPMASATGLNGEFITPVDLDNKEDEDEDEDEDEEGPDQGQRERKSPEGMGQAQKAEGEQPGDKPKESFVSTFLIGRLSSSKASDEDRAVVAGNTGPLEDSVFDPASSTPLIPEKKGTKPDGEDTSSSSSEDEDKDEDEEDASSSSGSEKPKDPAKRTSGGAAEGRGSSGAAMGEIHLQIDPASGITMENSHTDV